LYYRFKLVTGEEKKGKKSDISFTEWREEVPLSQNSEAEKIDAVTKLRAANPDAAISIERSQSKPK